MFQPDELVRFWFEGLVSDESTLNGKRNIWFSVNLKQDRMLRRRFMSLLMLGLEDGLGFWPSNKDTDLAKSLLLDRVAKSCYRNTPIIKDFETAALHHCDQILSKMEYKQEPTLRLIFLFMPYLASEKSKYQHKWLDIFHHVDDQGELGQLVSHLNALSERNMLVLERFGRFPHRAHSSREILTPAEKQFIEAYDWEHWL